MTHHDSFRKWLLVHEDNRTEHAESVSASDIIEQPCFRWTDSNTEKLIKLFKSYPCLYDTTKKEYHDHNKKKSAHETMTANFGITGKYNINMCDRLYTIYCLLV